MTARHVDVIPVRKFSSATGPSRDSGQVRYCTAIRGTADLIRFRGLSPRTVLEEEFLLWRSGVLPFSHSATPGFRFS